MDLLQLGSIITTQIKTRVTTKIGSKYPNLSFTDEVSDVQPSFPNVFIQEINNPEIGNSLENNTINYVDETIQIIVTTNTSKSDVKAVANACILALKEMSFSKTTGPLYSKKNNIHRIDLRFRRVIGGGDKFY